LIDVVACNLQLAAAYLKNSSFFIGNDSGLMHMAAAVETPTLGLFDPNSLPEKFRPWGSHCSYIHKQAFNPQKSYSPDNNSNELMKLISVKEVLTATEKLINKFSTTTEA
jgi:ADP-heptose:LPS heptosyltransferase